MRDPLDELQKALKSNETYQAMNTELTKKCQEFKVQLNAATKERNGLLKESMEEKYRVSECRVSFFELARHGKLFIEKFEETIAKCGEKLGVNPFDELVQQQKPLVNTELLWPIRKTQRPVYQTANDILQDDVNVLNTIVEENSFNDNHSIVASTPFFSKADNQRNPLGEVQNKLLTLPTPSVFSKPPKPTEKQKEVPHLLPLVTPQRGSATGAIPKIISKVQLVDDSRDDNNTFHLSNKFENVTNRANKSHSLHHSTVSESEASHAQNEISKEVINENSVEQTDELENIEKSLEIAVNDKTFQISRKSTSDQRMSANPVQKESELENEIVPSEEELPESMHEKPQSVEKVVTKKSKRPLKSAKKRIQSETESDNSDAESENQDKNVKSFPNSDDEKNQRVEMRKISNVKSRKVNSKTVATKIPGKKSKTSKKIESESESDNPDIESDKMENDEDGNCQPSPKKIPKLRQQRKRRSPGSLIEHLRALPKPKRRASQMSEESVQSSASNETVDSAISEKSGKSTRSKKRGSTGKAVKRLSTGRPKRSCRPSTLKEASLKEKMRQQ